MIVTWIAIQCQPVPWVEQRTDVAYVACGERAGELSLVRPEGVAKSPALERMLSSIEQAIDVQKDTPNLGWLRLAMPDQGTSIRLSPPRWCHAESYDEQVRRLAKASHHVAG